MPSPASSAMLAAFQMPPPTAMRSVIQVKSIIYENRLRVFFPDGSRGATDTARIWRPSRQNLFFENPQRDLATRNLPSATRTAQRGGRSGRVAYRLSPENRSAPSPHESS